MSVVDSLLSLVVSCAVAVGPIAVLLWLQNRRDRRAEALLQTVASRLPAETLRSDVALGVACRLLGRGATVRLGLGSAPVARLWETIGRLRRELPAWVRIEVDGQVEALAVPAGPVRVTVERTGPMSVLRPAA